MYMNVLHATFFFVQSVRMAKQNAILSYLCIEQIKILYDFSGMVFCRECFVLRKFDSIKEDVINSCSEW